VLKLITLSISSLILNYSLAAAPSTYTQIRMKFERTSQKELITSLNDFVKASAPSRMIGQPGHAKAKEHILQTIKKFDPKNSGKTIEDNFSPDAEEAKRFYQKDFDEQVEGKVPNTHPEYLKWLKFTTYMKQSADRLKENKGTNIIWEKNGINSNKVLVITAHYDTISHNKETLLIDEKSPMPGANFNASGVTVALNLIKILAEVDLNYSVQVVFLDWQGIGFLGSWQHAQQLKKDSRTIMGFVNLEMLGQDTSFFDKTKKTGNMGVYFRKEDEKFIQQLANHGSKITNKVSFELKPVGFSNSDNFRYWDQGFQGGTFTQNWEVDFNPKFYQTPQDTSETLNQQTLYYGYQYLGGAILGTLLDITR
jgi:hypothetical protein